MVGNTLKRALFQQLFAGLTFAAVGLFASRASAAGIAIPTAAPPPGGTKVIVVLKSFSAASEPPLIAQLKATGRLKRRLSTIPAIAASLTADEIAALGKNPSVAYIEVDQTLAATPSLSSAEESASWGVRHIGAAAAHASGITGAGVRVAVLDTGVDYNHPELSPRYQGGYNFMADPSDPLADPTDPLDDAFDSHGTQVAGIIAASLNNSGMVGVAPGVSLYAVKVLDGAGFGDLSSVLAGLEWSIANHMDVVNMSFGTSMDSQALQDVCNAAANAGIVLVAATGYESTSPVSYPAAYASVIGVSATDQNDEIAAFSPSGPAVMLVAPGVNIPSTQIGGGYVTLSGTSQAAPHVTGVAALLFGSGITDANGDGRRSDEVRARLQMTARDLGAAGKDDQYGYGLTDVRTAMSLCQADDYRLVRSSRPLPIADARIVSLEASSYQVKLVNHGLSAISVFVRPKGATQWNHFKTQLLSPNISNPINFNVTLQAPKEVGLVPMGTAGNWAQVTVTNTGFGCH